MGHSDSDIGNALWANVGMARHEGEQAAEAEE
jgi:hypothetical protein